VNTTNIALAIIIGAVAARNAGANGLPMIERDSASVDCGGLGMTSDKTRTLVEENALLRERLEAAEEALEQIEAWGDAYPTGIFPEPDWARARALLEGGGMTLDRVAAGCMRRAIQGAARIAREALAALRETEPQPPTGDGDDGSA
jgi:hypothetical protein